MVGTIVTVISMLRCLRPQRSVNIVAQTGFGVLVTPAVATLSHLRGQMLLLPPGQSYCYCGLLHIH